MSWKPILRCLKHHKRELNEIQQIICTHGHIDHVGSVNQIKRATGAKFLLHLADAKMFTNDYLTQLKDLKLLYQPKGVHRSWIQFLNWSNYAFINHFFEKVKPDRTLIDGDHVQVSGLGSLKVISTPGHTRGSICLWHEKLQTAFTGDTLLARNGRLEGPRHIFSESEREARRNITKLLKINPKLCVPGHFRLFSGRAFQEISKLIPPIL